MRTPLLLLVLLLAGLVRPAAAVDPADNTVIYEEPRHLPKVGKNITPYRQYFWRWAEAENAQRPERGTLAARPACTLGPPSLASKLYIVTNCLDANCAATGTVECLTKCNELGTAWDVGPCEVGATGAAGPTGPTGATGATGAGGSNALLDGVNHTDTAAGAVSRGAVIVGSATPKWSALPVGPTGQAVISNGTDTVFGVTPIVGGGTSRSNAKDAFDGLSPLFNVGDMIVYSSSAGVGPGSHTNGALAVGSNGQLLTADSTATPLGVKWGGLTDAQVPDILTLNLPSSTLTGLTADKLLVGTGTGTGAFNALPAGGTDGCSGTADKPIYTASTHTWGCGADAGAGGGMTSFLGAGDSGTVTVTNGETLKVVGGTGISTVAAGGTPELVTVNAASQEPGFLTDGGVTALTCGAANQGKAQVLDSGVLEYCDGATTSVVQRAALANASGVATSATALAANGSNCSGNNFALGVDASGNGECAQPTFANLGGSLTDAMVPDILTLNLPSSTLTGATANTSLIGTGTGTVAFGALPAGGTNGCSGTTDKPLYNATTHAWTCGVDGGGGGGMTSFSVIGDTGTAQTISNADMLDIAGGNGVDTVAGALGSDLLTVQVEDPLFITATAGVDCTGASDSSSGVNTAVAAAVAARRQLYIPSGCRLGLASPGAGNAAVALPAGTHIQCADASAGFFAVRQRCVGGTYPDAACASSAECLGGGTCSFDFGASTFAPTGGSTYTMLKDTAAGTDIQIVNCSLWTAQADPYQRCTAGTNAGAPCRQECTYTTGGSFPGFGCNSNAQCSGGTGGACAKLADCTTAGGACTGAPHGATGAGKINALDVARTSAVVLRGVTVRDHFLGDFGISTGTAATIEDSDAAAEIANCTTPYPGFNPSSTCVGSNAGNCCYGAMNFLTTNTQPTTGVTNGISAGANSKLWNTRGRGSTQAITLTGGPSTIDNSDAIPQSNSGPGTAGGGLKAVDNCTVTNSRVRFPASGATAIALTGTNTKAVANTIYSLGGAGIGISATGAAASIGYNYIEGAATTGAGISITGTQATVIGNHINSNGPDLLATGILVSAGPTNGSVLSDNVLQRLGVTSFWLQSGGGIRVVGNTSLLSGARPTSTLAPNHVRLDDGSTGGSTQITIEGNYFESGFRGVTTMGRTEGLTNQNTTGNRFVALAGALGAAGGAGSLFANNYLNSGGGGGPVLVCDASCTNRGAVCQQDTDCTGPCTSNGVARCLPEAQGYLGSPTASDGSAHPVWTSNLFFNGYGTTLQCTAGSGTVTNAGANCQISLATCTGGGGTCAGGPPATCSGGTQAGKLCCAGTGANVCGSRTDTPTLRMVDIGSSSGVSDAIVAGNNAIGTGVFNSVFLDMQSSAALGNIAIARMLIVANNLSAGGAANTTAIKFPTSNAGIADVNINGNTLAGWAVDVANWQGTFGSLAYTLKTMALPGDMTTSSTTFTDVQSTTGSIKLQVALAANRSYYFNCEMTVSVAGTGTGFAAAVTGPASPTTFTYISRLPALTVETTAGTDNMTEQEGNADDDTPTPITGVATANNKYTAAVRGNLITGATAGNLTARIKASNGTNALTIYKGSNCVVQQVP